MPPRFPHEQKIVHVIRSPLDSTFGALSLAQPLIAVWMLPSHGAPESLPTMAHPPPFLNGDPVSHSPNGHGPAPLKQAPTPAAVPPLAHGHGLLINGEATTKGKQPASAPALPPGSGENELPMMRDGLVPLSVIVERLVASVYADLQHLGEMSVYLCFSSSDLSLCFGWCLFLVWRVILVHYVRIMQIQICSQSEFRLAELPHIAPAVFRPSPMSSVNVP